MQIIWVDISPMKSKYYCTFSCLKTGMLGALLCLALPLPMMISLTRKRFPFQETPAYSSITFLLNASLLPHQQYRTLHGTRTVHYHSTVGFSLPI